MRPTLAAFSGSRIDTAVAQNGQRYADLDNAFAYRDKVSSNCSCNGKDGQGLARMDTMSDPTLRPGDIVATDTGLATYNGNSRTAEFTPSAPTTLGSISRMPGSTSVSWSSSVGVAVVLAW